MPRSISVSARSRLTLVVWLLGLIVAAVVIARRPVTQIRAVAWAGPVVLSAPEDGALLSLDVFLHQPVANGDIVARFDPSRLIDRGEILEAEFESLHQEEASAQKGRSRLLQRDEELAGLELAKLSSSIEEDEARLIALREKRVIDERLVAEGVVSSEKVEELRRDIAVVEARLAADRTRRILARRNLRQAGSRAQSAPGTNPWQAEAARRRLVEIEGRLERLSLRSSTSGQVSEIYRAPGEWLKAGEPVLRVSPLQATEVHAWLDSRASPDVVPGAAAEIRRADGQRLAGSVLSVGAERLPLPQALWARADLAEWGYLVRVAPSEVSLTPGEPVQVGLQTDP